MVTGESPENRSREPQPVVDGTQDESGRCWSLDRIIQEAEYAQERDEHIAFGIAAPRGTSKTNMMWSLEYYYPDKVTVFSDPSQLEVCLIGVLDDFGRKFYKRDFSKTEQKEFMKFLQVVRTTFPMLIVTLPRWDLMDVDLREFFHEVQLLEPGYLLIFGEEIYIPPAPAEYLHEKIVASKVDRRASLDHAVSCFK